MSEIHPYFSSLSYVKSQDSGPSSELSLCHRDLNKGGDLFLL